MSPMTQLLEDLMAKIAAYDTINDVLIGAKLEQSNNDS